MKLLSPEHVAEIEGARQQYCRRWFIAAPGMIARSLLTPLVGPKRANDLYDELVVDRSTYLRDSWPLADAEFLVAVVDALERT